MARRRDGSQGERGREYIPPAVRMRTDTIVELSNRVAAVNMRLLELGAKLTIYEHGKVVKKKDYRSENLWYDTQ